MGVSSQRSRAIRLEKQLKVALAGRMQEWSRERPELTDGGLATLNHVLLNNDLSTARIHVSFLGTVDTSAVLRAFSNLARRDRGAITRGLGLSRAPKLQFVQDTSPDLCARLDDIKAEGPSRTEGSSP